MCVKRHAISTAPPIDQGDLQKIKGGKKINSSFSFFFFPLRLRAYGTTTQFLKAHKKAVQF